MAKQCKIRIVKEINDLFPQYRPKVGEIYDARYAESAYNKYNYTPAICVIDILGKQIMVRKGEFEIVEVTK